MAAGHNVSQLKSFERVRMTKFDFNNPIKWIAEQKNEKVSYFYFLIKEKKKSRWNIFPEKFPLSAIFD